MKHRAIQWSIIILALAGIMVLGACKKKVTPPPPPPPPPPAAPTASLTANPSTIQQGQSTTLTWETQNATDVTLDGNKVDANGSQTVSPTDSTTYHLVAKGAGGSQESTARVTVTPPPPPPPPAPSPTDMDLFNTNVKDIFFDYDSYDIKPDQQSVIQGDAAFLKQHPNITFTIEGHCDERGSTEYNLALGDNRANAVKNALVQAGVDASRIKTISYGKEKPFCTESNESCWQQNRRGHFVYGK
ncbi:MAG TPA: peptidoglycan-associated lipoprotein Pal [Terriglobales bacterium]|nr:peptidoglycan-associated lipoprotein Pal [Terriglobales bacterium]